MQKCFRLKRLIFILGYVRIAKCGIALGDLTIADQAIKKVKELDVDNSTIDNEVRSLEALKQFEREATVAFEKKDYRKVVYCMDRCLQHAPTCVRYKITKAECLAFLGRTVEAQDIANNILHVDSGNADAIYVRGICLFYQDNVDKAFSHFQQVLRLAPDHKKCMNIYKRSKQLKQKKEEGIYFEFLYMYKPNSSYFTRLVTVIEFYMIGAFWRRLSLYPN